MYDRNQLFKREAYMSTIIDYLTSTADYLYSLTYHKVQLTSVTQSCLTFWNPMDCSMPGFPAHHYLPELAQTHVCCVKCAIQPSYPLSPSSTALSLSQHQGLFNESALCIRWPKYWSFSFSISPSNEYSGLISFRIDWFDLLALQGALKSLLQYHHCSKVSISSFCNGFKYA